MGTDKGDEFEGDNLPNPPADGNPETNPPPSWIIIVIMLVAAGAYGLYIYHAKQNGTDPATEIAVQQKIRAQEQLQQANSPDNSDTVHSAATSHPAPASVPNNQMDPDQNATTYNGNPYSGSTSNTGNTTSTPKGSTY